MGRAGGRGGGGGSRGGSFGGSRGGSFGGGRSSSSFSGSRSSSNFGRSSSSFGSSASNRSYSSSNRTRHTTGGYGGGFWGVPRTTGPIIINNSGNNNNKGYVPNKPINPNNNTHKNNSTGCIHIILVIIMIMSILMVLFNSVLLIGSDREQRTKLNADINVTSYYTDELHWINDSSDIERGLKYFYEKTGVQPHVYITDDVGGDFYDNVEDFANNKYDELFSDEAHLLLIFWEQDYYATYCLSGVSADTVIDAEARDIILDKIDEYYWADYLSDEEFFSKVFSEAADEIMEDTSSGVGAVIVPLIIFAIALAAEIIVTKKAKQAKKDAELKEMLNKPLETFGSTEAEDLAKKYQDTQNNTTITDSDEFKENSYEEVKKYCPRCGAELEQDYVFCSNCGNKI